MGEMVAPHHTTHYTTLHHTIFVPQEIQDNLSGIGAGVRCLSCETVRPAMHDKQARVNHNMLTTHSTEPGSPTDRSASSLAKNYHYAVIGNE